MSDYDPLYGRKPGKDKPGPDEVEHNGMFIKRADLERIVENGEAEAIPVRYVRNADDTPFYRPGTGRVMDPRFLRIESGDQVADIPLTAPDDFHEKGHYGLKPSAHFGLPAVSHTDKSQMSSSRSKLPAITHPRDLLPIRDAVTGVMSKTENGRDVDPSMRGWLADPSVYEMYFARPDFADLYAEVRGTMAGDMFDLMNDIAREKGDHGAMIIAFDERHQPGLPMTFRLSPALDTVTKMMGAPDFEDAQERRPTPTAWVVYAWEIISGSVVATSMVIPGRTVNTTGLISSDDKATEEAAVVAWLMLAAQGSLVEHKTVEAGAGLPPKVKKDLGKGKKSKITVIDLRKTVRQGMRDVQEADRRHLDHRFIVRGHKRLQPCGAGRAERRVIYVAPYVKGSPDMPFIHREKVFRY